ncbi:MAG: family 16 glycosylhydrolase [Clostridiales bacterium]|jgi:beta-glucanase (GH16 family)|nr:family 16 glycosylhydrolase [Clostridiales bacterium]
MSALLLLACIGPIPAYASEGGAGGSGDSLIIDNGGAGFQVVSGSWSTSWGVTGYNGSSTLYVQGGGYEVRWAPAEPLRGVYSVEAYKTVHSGHTETQVYDVFIGGENVGSRTFNMKEGEPGWQELGEYSFTGAECYVSVTSLLGGTTRVDAVRFAWVGELPGDEPGEPGEPGEGGGDPSDPDDPDAPSDPDDPNDPDDPDEPGDSGDEPDDPSDPADPDDPDDPDDPGDGGDDPDDPGAPSGTVPEDELAHDGPDYMLIDDGQSGFVAYAGKWTSSAAARGYDGNNARWAEGLGPEARYVPTTPLRGKYRVSAWRAAHANNTSNQVYTIIHNGKQHAFAVNMKIEPSAWDTFGVFDFAGELYEYVSVTDPLGGTLRVDAVRFEKVAPETPLAPGGEPASAEALERPVPPTLIEASSSGRYVNTGAWEWAPGNMVGPLRSMTQIMLSAQAGAEGKWFPQTNAVGPVRISAYRVAYAGGDSAAAYTVFCGGEETVVPVDFTAGKSGWMDLGTYQFTADSGGSGTGETGGDGGDGSGGGGSDESGGDGSSGDGSGVEEYVSLKKLQGGKGQIYASAIRFEILSENADYGSDVWQTIYVNINSVLVPEDIKPAVSFGDLDGHWAKLDIEAMANRGFAQGVSEGVFDPDSPETQGNYLGLLAKAASLGDAPYDAASDPAGLLAGLPAEGGFDPARALTKEALALMTFNADRYLNKNEDWLPAFEDGFDSFEDSGAVSPWAAAAVRKLLRMGVVAGESGGGLDSQKTMTRAEATVALKKFMQAAVWAGPPASASWELAFQDEFFGSSLDWGVWNSQDSYSPHILSSRHPENAVVGDGLLRLTTKYEDRGLGAQWTSAHLYTGENFEQAYGYWEARYRYAASAGLNQSFWMSTGEGGGFELDINEGHYPNALNMSLHAYNRDAGKKSDNSKRLVVSEDLSLDFHTYAIEWNEEEIVYYFDGAEVDRKPALNAQSKVHPMLSTAVLEWAGPVTMNLDGKSMDVDYVRVYSKNPDAPAEPAQKGALASLAANAGAIRAEIFEPGAAAAFELALAAAERALADPEASQAGVDAAAAALGEAMDRLELSGAHAGVDGLADLAALLIRAAKLDGSQYTAASWGRLEGAVARAWGYIDSHIAETAGVVAGAAGATADGGAEGGAATAGNAAQEQPIGAGGAEGSAEDGTSTAGGAAQVGGGVASSGGTAAAGNGAPGGAAQGGGGETLAPMASVSPDILLLISELSDAIAGLERLPSEPQAGAPKIYGSVGAIESEALLITEDILAGAAPALEFSVSGRGIAGVGAVNIQVSLSESLVDPLNPAAVSFSLPDGLKAAAFAEVDAAGQPDGAAQGYATHSIYIFANPGTTLTLPDGQELLRVSVRLADAGAKSASLLLNKLEATYWDDGEPIDAEAAIERAVATSAVRAVSRYDVNRDGAVTLADVDAVRFSLGKRAADDDWGAWPITALCDFDGSGEIDIADLTRAIAKYESTAGA